MTGLALVVSGVVFPRTLIAVTILLRIESKNGKVAHFAVRRLHSKIGNSRLLRTISAVVTLAACSLLLRGEKVERVFTNNAINHRGHRGSPSPHNVARGSPVVLSSNVFLKRDDVLPNVGISPQFLATIINVAFACVIFPKIDKMIHRANLSICLKCAVSQMNIKIAVSDKNMR
jgi:hypothetical protein